MAHWTPWTWKYRAPDSLWGLYAPPTTTTIDVRAASFEEILAALEGFDTAKGWRANAGYEAALRAHAGAAAAPRDLAKLSSP